MGTFIFAVLMLGWLAISVGIALVIGRMIKYGTGEHDD